MPPHIRSERIGVASAAATPRPQCRSPPSASARASVRSQTRWSANERSHSRQSDLALQIGVAGALRQPSVECGDPRFLLLDDGEQLDDRLAHDERCLFPTGGIQWKPCQQWEKGRHCSPLAAGNDRCNQRSPHVISDLRPRPALFPLGIARRSYPWRGTTR
jgi:hypothetical protein